MSATGHEEARPRGRKAEQSEATRTALVRAARQLFAKRGYAAVGTEEIVSRAGVTRGALYHHFRGKDDLFRAVCEQVETELTQKIAARALGGDDPLAALQAGADMFLDAAREPEVQQIALLDAPSVLGWEAWREIGERYGLGLIQAALQAAMESGAIAEQPIRPLAHVLLGALDEAAMYLARAHDPKQARAEVGATVARLIEGLQVR
jgi:AcrR family transcriptional regulator